jgi:fructosamine-3-kinase
MLPDSIKEFIQLNKSFEGEPIKIENCFNLSGGCINDAALIKTNIGEFFIKWNIEKKYPAMLEKEAKSLEFLAKYNLIDVPEVIFFDYVSEYQFLVLQYIKSGIKVKNFWEDFAVKLANIHMQKNKYFGFEFDNYIGSLSQSNNYKDNWSDFFIEERLVPMIKMARDSNKISSVLVNKFNNFFKKIDEIFPDEQPSLLHGDLWNGNFMVNENGYVCFIDPAVYFGFREMDIAMSKLFGGFDSKFYETYNEYYQMEKGWEVRLDYCNLYPLLVHVNLFGGGYINSVERILSKF